MKLIRRHVSRPGLPAGWLLLSCFGTCGRSRETMLDLVKDELDLVEITGTYGSERGQPPYDPTMMTRQRRSERPKGAGKAGAKPPRPLSRPNQCPGRSR